MSSFPNPRGRPTKYLPEYADQLHDYFAIDAGKDVAYESNGEPKVARTAADFPTLAGFACQLGVHRETMIEWTKKFPDFADAYKRAKEHQERILVQNGLKDGYHANFAIFTAKNVIGYRDKLEHEMTGKDGTPLMPEITDEALARRIAFILTKVA